MTSLRSYTLSAVPLHIIPLLEKIIDTVPQIEAICLILAAALRDKWEAS